MDSAEEDHYDFTAASQIFSLEKKKHLQSKVTQAVLIACNLSSELHLCSHKILLGAVSESNRQAFQGLDNNMLKLQKTSTYNS